MIKTAIPLVLAVVFSNPSLANARQPDLNTHLQAQVQTSFHSLIDARLGQMVDKQQTTTLQRDKQRFAVQTTSHGPQSTHELNAQIPAHSIINKQQEN